VTTRVQDCRLIASCYWTSQQQLPSAGRNRKGSAGRN
jgi:hypothetical protein